MPGYEIKTVNVIYNSQLTFQFSGVLFIALLLPSFNCSYIDLGRVNLLEERHGKKAFEPHWEEDSKLTKERENRRRVMKLFHELASPHTYDK